MHPSQDSATKIPLTTTQTTMSDVRERPDDVLDLADYEIEVTKEDVTVLKDDWLTDNVIAFWEEYARLLLCCLHLPSLVDGL